MVNMQYSVPDMSECRNPKHLERCLSRAEDRVAELMNVKHVLMDLLSEEINKNDINADLLRDVSEERDDYRRRLSDIKHFINELKPGQRITEKIIEQINRF